MIRYDNVVPASPAMARTILALHRAFANKWGVQKSNARRMCGIGPRSLEARARYGDIAAQMKKDEFNIHDAIISLQFFRRIEKAKIAPNKYQLARHLEALMLLRWLRRNNPRSYYAIRDALTSTATIMPRSW